MIIRSPTLVLSTTYEYALLVQGHRKIIFPFRLLSLSSCGSLTRPYIIDTIEEELPQNEEGNIYYRTRPRPAREVREINTRP